jgi:hypothetical protein
LIVLIAIAAVAVVLWLFGGDVNGMNAKVTPMLTVAVIFLGLAGLLVVGMTAMNMGKGRGNSKIGLYVFGGLAVLAVIIWFVWAKSTEVIGADGKPLPDSAFTLKASDTMLYLAYASLALTVIFLLVGEVRKAIK